MSDVPPPRWLALEIDAGAAGFFGLPEQLYLPELEATSVLDDGRGSVFLERLARALEKAAALDPALEAEPGILRFLRRWERYLDLDRYLRVGNAPFARAVARGLLSDDPGDPPPHLALAGLAIEEEHWDEAAGHLAAALDRAPEHALTRLYHALVLAGAGRREESLEALDRLTRSRLQSLARYWRYEVSHRGEAELAERLQSAFARLPALDDAASERDAQEAVLGRAPDNPEVLYLFALSDPEAADPSPRETALRRAVEADPGHLPARVLLCEILVETGRSGEALGLVDAGIVDRPFAPELHAARGRALERLGRREAARAAYRAVFEGPLALVPGPALLAAGAALLRLGAVNDTRALLLDAMEARPGDPLPHQLLARMDEAMEGAAAAETRLREAIRAVGRHPVLEYALGDLLRRQGRRLEAEGIMKVLVERHPRSPWGHRGLGDLVLEENPARALERYASAKRLDPHLPIPGYDYLRGVAALRAGDVAVAVRALERAAFGDPDRARNWCDLGAAYFVAGRLDRALAVTERALALEPEHPGFLHNLSTYHAARFRRRPWRLVSAWKAWTFRRRSERRRGDRGWERDLWRPGEAPARDPREEPPPA
jgi:predicted Zn-dependent protease